MFSTSTFDILYDPIQKPPEVVRKRISRKFSFSKLPYWLSGQHIECYNPPPEKGNGKTLVLDLDETLVHFSTLHAHSDVKSIEVGSPPYTVFLRPDLEEFLKFALGNFDVFIYTYGDRNYAEPILNVILPSLDESHRLYRDSCQLKKGSVFKDLEMFERKPERIILVDDNRAAARFHPQNTLHIVGWEGTPLDHALMEWLVPILKKCLAVEDVRDVISNVPKRGRLYRMASTPC
jgi:CTD small phosphatase-like protein 2